MNPRKFEFVANWFCLLVVSTAWGAWAANDYPGEPMLEGALTAAAFSVPAFALMWLLRRRIMIISFMLSAVAFFVAMALRPQPPTLTSDLACGLSVYLVTIVCMWLTGVGYHKLRDSLIKEARERARSS